MSDGLRDAFAWNSISEQVKALASSAKQAEQNILNTIDKDDPDQLYKSTAGITWDFDDEDTKYIDLGDLLGDGLGTSSGRSTNEWTPWNVKRCECGSAHTSAPNIHLRFCPLFTEPMGDG